MNIALLEAESGQKVFASIRKATLKDAPSKKDGWAFDWRELFKTEGSSFFKIVLDESAGRLEGLLMLSVYFGEVVYMNNLELAPHNVGRRKRYDFVAGSLIAYGCRFSLEEGKGNYHGYLTFESKSELIPLYEKKYGAVRTLGQKMFIAPIQGEKLIEQYLNSVVL